MVQVIRETHETPEFAARLLQLAGGINRFGEPNYRLVWGWNRLDWIGGKFVDYDENTGEPVRERIEMRREPKYPQVNRWLIEQWVAPEKYGSPMAWWAATKEWREEGNVPQLGPYPERGDYELVAVLESPLNEFVALDMTEALNVAHSIERTLKHKRSYGEGLAIKKAALAKKKAAQVEQDYEVLDDAVGAFHELPHVTVL